MVINLGGITTFGIDVNANVFIIKNTINLLDYFNNHNKEDYFVIGGGSNIILSPSVSSKNILKIEIMGRDIVHTENTDVFVKIGAGENWDGVVKWAVENNYSGIESLSAIPGTAGATPVQNVGAYGREIKDVFISLTAYDTLEKKLVTIKNEDCNFSYRNSIFKSTQKGRYIIIDIILKLSTLPPAMPEYVGVQKYFENLNIDSPTLQQIRDAIIEIRWSKLPHPEDWGNCGSFFENPIVEKSIYKKLKLDYPDMPSFEVNEDMVKIPAGWLLENAGLKGFSFGNVSTYDKNALVLINTGNANYNDVLNAKNTIISIIKDKFGIELKSEPEFV